MSAAPRSCETHGHCWHIVLVLLSTPAQLQERCCWCGAERPQAKRIPTRSHGPHAP
jgi:hypothetical protein